MRDSKLGHDGRAGARHGYGEELRVRVTVVIKGGHGA